MTGAKSENPVVGSKLIKFAILALISSAGGALQRTIFFYAYEIWNQRRGECPNQQLDQNFDLADVDIIASDHGQSVKSIDWEGITKPTVKRLSMNFDPPARVSEKKNSASATAVKLANMHWENQLKMYSKLVEENDDDKAQEKKKKSKLLKPKKKKEKTIVLKAFAVDKDLRDPNKYGCDYVRLEV